MTRYSKKNGNYIISGSKFEMLTGSRAQVWHGTAFKTTGGLKKSNLTKNKAGRIISKLKYITSKKDNRLIKSGYGTKKGKFGFVRLNITAKRGKSKKMKGGMVYGSNVNPAHFTGSSSNAGSTMYNGIDGQGLTQYTMGPSSVDVQLAAGQAAGSRRKKMKGGMVYGSNVNPAPFTGSSSNAGSSMYNGIDGQGLTQYTMGPSSVDVQLAAGQAAGSRRKKMKGGMVYGSNVNPAPFTGSSSNAGSSMYNGIDGQGLTQYTMGPSSVDVQLAAGQAAGSRRKKIKLSKKKRGGTGFDYNIPIDSPLGAALNAN
jgi:hypothetical protein